MCVCVYVCVCVWQSVCMRITVFMCQHEFERERKRVFMYSEYVCFNLVKPKVL